MRIIQQRALAAALSLITIAAAAIPASTIRAQEAASKPPAKKVLTPEEKAAADLARGVIRAKAMEAFFSATEPVQFTLTTNIKRIRGDKGDKAPWRWAAVSYTDATGKQVSIPTQIRTRGIWRLKNCEFPPTRLNFKSEAIKGTILQGLDRPKLVSYCRDNDEYEQYIIEEMQLYRVYSLLTPAGHRVRLAALTYADSASGKVIAKRTAFILEEPDVMAARLGGPIMPLKGAVADDLDPFHDALVGVFEYFIGNTDFSTYALHNVELVNQPSGMVIPVPYDFDFAGVISANYATTDPSLPIQRVRDRMFRGYCRPNEDYTMAYARFNEKKAEIYALYSDSIGKMLRPNVVAATLKYFDDFYKTINDAKRAKNAIADDCVKTQ